MILTSVEFDHADIYKDLDAVETAFRRLVNLVPGRGRIIAFDSGKSLDTCLAKSFSPVERYGSAEGSNWRISNLRMDSASTGWTIDHNGHYWANVEFGLAGEYIVRNATAAAALARSCGLPKDAISADLKIF